MDRILSVKRRTLGPFHICLHYSVRYALERQLSSHLAYRRRCHPPPTNSQNMHQSVRRLYFSSLSCSMRICRLCRVGRHRVAYQRQHRDYRRMCQQPMNNPNMNHLQRLYFHVLPTLCLFDCSN